MLACLACVAWLVTQSPPQPPSFRQEIVVTAERGQESAADTTTAVTVLTHDQLELLPAENLGAILETLAGFRMLFGEDYEGRSMSSSRGFFGGGEVDYVRLLVDGIPVGDVETGLAEWRDIRVQSIDRIEVVHGPASSLYGDTAIGGVVQVFTRRETIGLTSLSLSTGSFETFTVEGAHQGGSLRVGATGTTTEGFREHGAARSATADFLMRAGPAWDFRLFASHLIREEPGPRTGDELGTDRFDSSPMFRFDEEETDRVRAAITYRQETPFLLRGSLYGSVRSGEGIRTLLLAPGFSDRAMKALDTEAIGISLETEQTLLKGTSDLRAGMDLGIDSVDTNYFRVGDDGEIEPQKLSSVKAERRRSGVFLSGDWRPWSAVRLSGGLRWDQIDDRGSGMRRSNQHALSPRIGVNARVGEPASPLVLFAQYSGAFKAPTLDQRFDPRPFPDGFGGRFTISNPDLKPQRARNLEVGLMWSGTSLRLEATAYRMTVTDEIDFDPSLFRYHNIGESLHQGVGLRFHSAAARRIATDLSYAWSRVEPRTGEFRGRQLKNLPEHEARAGLLWNGEDGFSCGLWWSWLGEWFLDDENTIRAPATSIIDARLMLPFRQGKVTVDLLNVLDTESTELGFVLADFAGGSVPYAFPSPGFAARITVHLNLGVFDPGQDKPQ